jgi:hypothetical protein
LRVPLRELGLRSAPARWIVASIGLVVPFMAFVWVYNALLEHAGVVYENQWVLDRAADQSGSASFWIAMMHGSLLVPFLEEALFRGSLQTAAIRRLGSCKGIGLTAITFGSMHMPDPYAVLPLVGLGVVLGWLRHRSNSLWPSVVLHATNNAVAFLVVGFEIL